jgi:VanZ family protein
VMRTRFGRLHAGWEIVRRWGPLCLWMMTISAFSTSAFSAAQTGRFIEPFLRWLLPGVHGETILALHGVIRKGMHVAEFAVLAVLWYRGLSWEKRGWQPAAALAALGFAVSTGMADEIHQAFVPSRTASALDVAWDSLGALCGLAGWAVLAGALRPRKNRGALGEASVGRLEVSAGD